MISEDVVSKFIEKLPQVRNGNFSDYLSRTRDVFDARLMTYTTQNQNWLLGAIIGEIGANTFDHNFSFRSDVPKGVFFDYETVNDYIFICDFGAGLRTTLSRAVKNLQNDLQAIKTAFTEPVSGRAPEMRGNGLKFALSSVVQNKWNLYFQSGNAYCKADKEGFFFGESSYNHEGCFCILSCKEV